MRHEIPTWLVVLTLLVVFLVFWGIARSRYNACVEEGYSTAYCAEAYDFIQCGRDHGR